jgi:hypothetical protein
MSVITLEGTVENGQIRLQEDVRLPEKTRVFVVIPNWRTLKEARVYSPRLVRPDQAADFNLEVIESEEPDAPIQS